MTDWGGIGGSFSTIGDSFTRTGHESLGARYLRGARDDVEGMVKAAEATSRGSWERLGAPWRIFRALLSRDPRRVRQVALGEVEREGRNGRALLVGLGMASKHAVETGTPLAVPHYLGIARDRGAGEMFQTMAYDAGHATVQAGLVVAGEGLGGSFGSVAGAGDAGALGGSDVAAAAEAVDGAASSAPVARDLGAAAGESTRAVPHGFTSIADVEDFTAPLHSALAEKGVVDGDITLVGSAVTGVKYDSGMPFDSGGELSDLDLGVASETLFERAEAMKIPLRGGGTRTGVLTADQLADLDLGPALREMNESSGRRVTLMLYRSLDDVAKRGPMMVLP